MCKPGATIRGELGNEGATISGELVYEDNLYNIVKREWLDTAPSSQRAYVRFKEVNESYDYVDDGSSFGGTYKSSAFVPGIGLTYKL